jgi:hypothetical protein
MARSIRIAAIILFILLSGLRPASAQTDELLNSLEYRSYVNDFAEVMGNDARAVETFLTELDQSWRLA